MQSQDQVVEAHHLLKPARQLVKQRGQVPVRDDRLRNRQQGTVLVRGEGLPVSWIIRHEGSASISPSCRDRRHLEPLPLALL